MLDLPKDLRTKLKDFYSVGSLKLISEQISKDGIIYTHYINYIFHLL